MSTSAVTSRRRRRRLVVDSNNKENVDSVQQQQQRDDDIVLSLKTTNRPDSDRDSDNVDADNYFETAACFSAASSFWKKQSSTFLKQVVFSSQTLSTSLLVQESEVALLNACRSSVKAATEEKVWSHVLWTNLYVATVGLRALLSCSMESPETIIKLCYHALVTLSDRLRIATTTTTTTNCTSCESVPYVVLALYDTMGRGLQKLQTESTRFKPPSSSSSVALEQLKFPVPTKSSVTTLSSSLPLRQVLKIGIQSTLAIANILFKFPNDERSDVTARTTSSRVDFGRKITQSLHNVSYELIRDVIHHIFTPWTRIYISQSLSESLSFAKAAHRLLWDIATEGGMDALKRREDAILALLLVTPGDHKRDIVIQPMKKHGELAATYAWKAAATHVQQHSITIPILKNDENPLSHFHVSIGGLLDKMMLTNCFAYSEYCAYRVLHLGVTADRVCTHDKPCIYQGLPDRNCTHSRVTPESASLGDVTLGLVILLASVEDTLVSSGKDDLAHFENETQSQEICTFLTDVLQAALGRSTENISACYKLFQYTGLSQKASKFRKDLEQGRSISSVELNVMGITARILTDCFVPLQQRMAQIEKDVKIRQSYWDSLIDSYSRVISLYDATPAVCSAKHDALIMRACEVVSNNLKRPSFSVIERFAKLLFSVGKRRNEATSQNMLVPLVLSVNLLTRLESLTSDPDFVSSSQLVSRYSYVATLLSTSGETEAAVLSLVASLAYDTMAISSNVNPLDSIVSFVLDLSTGFPRPRKSTLSLIHRLVQVLSRMGSKESILALPKPTLISVADTLKDLVLHPHSERDMSADLLDFETLLSSVFSDLLCRSSSDGRGLLIEVQARTTAFMIMALGHAVKEMNSDSEENQVKNLPHALKSMSRLFFRLLKLITGENKMSASFLQGMAHFVAALSLTQQDVLDKRCLSAQLYWQQLDRTVKLFDECRNGGMKEKRSELVSSVLRADALYQQNQLTGGSKQVSLMQPCHEIVTHFFEGSFDKEDALIGRVYMHFQALLSSLRSQYVLNGDHYTASKVSHWSANLSQKWGKCENSENWFSAGAIRSLKQADLSHIGSSLIELKSNERACSEYVDLFKVEYNVQVLHLKAGFMSPRELSGCIAELQQILTGISRHPESGLSATDQVLRFWVTSSIFLALSEANLQEQCLHQAIQNTKNCMNACQNGSRIAQKVHYEQSQQPPLFFSLSSLDRLFMERQLSCMLNLAWAHDMLGDYRKAEAYLLSTAEQTGLQMPTKNRVDIRFLGKLKVQVKTPQQMSCFRELVAHKARIHSYSQLKDDVWKQAVCLDFPFQVSVEDDLFFQLETFNVAATFLAQSRQSQYTLDSKMVDDLLEATSRLSMSYYHVSSTDTCRQLESGNNKQVFGNTIARVRLSLVSASFNGTYHFSHELEREAICNGIISNVQSISPSLRAMAYYFLGLLSLFSARESESLRGKWEKRRLIHMYHLDQAQDYFEKGLELVNGSSPLLYRDLCRSLALTLGPEGQSKSLNLSADALVHASIGQTSKASYVRNLRAHGADRSKIEKIFAAEGEEIFDIAKTYVPACWNIIAAVLCPTGELLITSFVHGMRECVCVFPGQDSDHVFNSSIYDEMMSPLDDLIQRNDAQLNGIDEKNAAEKFNDISAKRDWWSARQKLDDSLAALLSSVHELYFSGSQVRSMLGSNIQRHGASGEPSPRGNLASRFEAALEVPAHDEDISKLKVAEIKQELLSLSISFPSKARKADLLQLLKQQRDLIRTRPENSHCLAHNFNSVKGDDKKECVVMVLDENLHRFPFEGLPFLQGRAVTRVPSLPFLLASLLDPKSVEVDPRNMRYVVDPESNLGKTAERIMPFIESTNEENGWDWAGVVGEFPSEDFVVDSITKEDGLFFYCGHGGGRGSFSKTKIESLVEKSKCHTPCRSTVILMGCSSGKLASVNRKHVNAAEQVQMHYEPEGIALSYILAGAPCVVGNLWDVTDRDIDRYCLSFMGNFLKGEGDSLAKCVAESRGSCKMKHIVGLAPVCYGLPVVARNGNG